MTDVASDEAPSVTMAGLGHGAGADERVANDVSWLRVAEDKVVCYRRWKRGRMIPVARRLVVDVALGCVQSPSIRLYPWRER